MGATNWVHIDVKLVKAATEKALLIVLEDGSEYWLPRSQVDEPDRYTKGMTDCTISASEWICQQKGIDFA